MYSTSSKTNFYFRNMFYSFLGFQGHIICNFLINRTLDMNFLKFRHFLFLKPNSKSYLIEGCHVVCSGSLVPVWPDLCWPPSDFKCIGWSRTDDTDSVFKQNRIHWIWIQRLGSRLERSSPGGGRRRESGASGGQQWGISGGF
jgi:hypothetical protein